jgi:hypothetical protein
MQKPFDLMDQFGKFATQQQISLRDPGATPAFLRHVEDSVSLGLGDSRLLQGQRAEAMFEDLVVSLGGYKMLKREDNGHVYSDERCIAPDFRIVLETGETWLVEVKNVYEPEPFEQVRELMTPEYRAALETYAAMAGGALKLAVFWARWSIWTLVSPEQLLSDDGYLILEMGRALQVSELGRLGDRTIGTRAPIIIRFVVNDACSQPINAEGMANVVFAGAETRSGDLEIEDPEDQQLAHLFIEYGEWRETGPHYIVEGDRLQAVEFRYAPPEVSDQGFEFVGTLSRMFARYFAKETMRDGDVVQLNAPQKPAWFAPIIRRDRKSGALPLWVFELQPNFDA